MRPPSTKVMVAGILERAALTKLRELFGSHSGAPALASHRKLMMTTPWGRFGNRASR